jgi:capsular exopolysaccharide synthesis family protein
VVPPRYESIAEILLLDPATRNLGMGDRSLALAADGSTIADEISLLTSQSLALRVARQLRLASDPEFIGDYGKSDFPGNSDQGFAAAAQILRKHIKVERPANSYVLQISVTASAPKKAQQLTETLVQQFLDDERQARREALEQTKGWWTQRLDVPDVGGRIITAASLPTTPSFPKPMPIFAIAAILSTLIGAAVAGLVEVWDDTLRTLDAAKRIVGHPPIGMIPLIDDGVVTVDNHTLVNRLVDAPFSHLSEMVRLARVNLRVGALVPTKKILLITSALPGEGKSATAMLISTTNALLGEKTVLVDCDFRRASISSQFFGTGTGWNEVLAGSAELDAVTVKVNSSSLFAIPVGCGANPANALLGQGMRDLLKRLKMEYDLVVLDAAPVLGAADAAALSSLADETLLVVEWGRTPAARILEALRAVSVSGRRSAALILNKVNLQCLRSYDDSYSAYGSGSRLGVIEACYDGW